MKEYLKGIKIGLGITTILIIVGVIVFFVVKARTTTDPNLGDDGSSLYTEVNGTLTAAKRNALVKKANPQISATEYDTGKKWIDGKTIYGQFVTVGAMSNASSSYLTLDKVNSISNLDQITGIFCFGRNTGNQFFLLPDRYTQCGYIPSTSKLTVYYTSNRSTRTAYAIIEYTKN